MSTQLYSISRRTTYKPQPISKQKKNNFSFYFSFLQLPPRLIKLTLVTCLLVVIISQTDCAEGKLLHLNQTVETKFKLSLQINENHSEIFFFYYMHQHHEDVLDGHRLYPISQSQQRHQKFEFVQVHRLDRHLCR